MGKSRELVQVVAQARQIAEDGVVFLDEVLHDLDIDGCLPDIFGQCADTLIRTYANTQTHICACVLNASLR